MCLHTNKRRPCSSTLSGHPSSSLRRKFAKLTWPSTKKQPSGGLMCGWVCTAGGVWSDGSKRHPKKSAKCWHSNLIGFNSPVLQVVYILFVWRHKNPFPQILNVPQKPWFSRGFTCIGTHLGFVFRGMGWNGFEPPFSTCVSVSLIQNCSTAVVQRFAGGVVTISEHACLVYFIFYIYICIYVYIYVYIYMYIIYPDPPSTLKHCFTP